MNLYDFLTENIDVFDEKKFILGKESYTYKNLKEETSTALSMLEGIQGEKILLVSTNNSFFISRYLAILKSGNICVPVDNKINSDRIRYIIEECKICYAFFDAKAKRTDILKVVTELNTLGPENFYSNEESYPNKDKDPAVILYTSGSTGIPKGVVLSHGNLRSNTASIITYLDIRKDDRQMVVLPFFYSYGLSLLNTFLRQNASMVINTNLVFPKFIIEDMKKYDVTFMAGVPSVYQTLINKTKFLETKFSHLRCMTQAGGHLFSSYKEKILESHGQIDFVTMYGATEASARLTYLPSSELKKNINSIGREIPGVEIVLRKKDGSLADLNEEGEICAKGDNIMLGYFNDEELTKKTIINGFLLTGDIGKRDKNKNITIIGRKKNFIKSYGYRIVPLEIENFLLKIDGILECAITHIADDDAGQAMIAYIALDKNTNLKLINIKMKMQKELPSYKCPKEYKILESLPKSSSGKILRNELK